MPAPTPSTIVCEDVMVGFSSDVERTPSPRRARMPSRPAAYPSTHCDQTAGTASGFQKRRQQQNAATKLMIRCSIPMAASQWLAMAAAKCCTEADDQVQHTNGRIPMARDGSSKDAATKLMIRCSIPMAASTALPAARHFRQCRWWQSARRNCIMSLGATA